LLETAYRALRPGGRMVVNVATLEGLGAAYEALKRCAGPVEALLINVARGTDQLETLRFEALNPNFLLTVGKSAGRS
jgi:precorrin-6B C5,15-methyltransferase / cobalt-precorrin-6B C5,C15-methyltransferase